MSDEEMLKNDMDNMDYDEVLDLLRCHQDLSRFDANTGETDSLHFMKNCTNDLNYPMYVAISKCISLLEYFKLEEGYLKRLNRYYIIPKCDHCNKIIHDLMVETSNYNCSGAIQSIKRFTPGECPNCGMTIGKVVVDEIKKIAIVKEA